jgi:hypothetical protein
MSLTLIEKKYEHVVLDPPFREIFFKNLIAAKLMGGYDFNTKSVAHKNS